MPPIDVHERRVVQVLRQFRQLYGAFRRHFREVEAACGLPGSHMWMLREIERREDVGLSELAAVLSIHVSTASQMAERLVREGFVRKERSTEDQRRIGLRITPLGKQLLARAPQPAEGRLPAALLALPDRTLNSLHTNLVALLREVGELQDGDAETPMSEL